MNTVFLILLAYFCGAIPTGYWVVKAKTGVDLTQVGSGSTGTTNVLRTAGKSAAALVFFIDIFKGFVPVWLSIYMGNHGMLPEYSGNGMAAQWVPFACGIIALVGHGKSIFLRFKGGKSAATSLGVAIAMNWLAAMSSFALFVTVVLLGRIVSIASILAVISSAFTMWFLQSHANHILGHGPLAYASFCALGAIYVTYKHKDNIKRLLAGTEPRIGQKLNTAAPKADQE